MSLAASPLDADTVLYAARVLSERWLGPVPLDALSPGSFPIVIRMAAISVIYRSAKVMALAPGRVGGDCCTDYEQLEGWLGGCMDALAQPDAKTSPERVIPPFGAESVTDDPVLGRWTAGLRESTQAMGVRWVRGRADGPCRFSVGSLGGRCTVFEHGVPDDALQLQKRMVGAVATAVVQRSRSQGQKPLSVDRTAGLLLEQATEYCASSEAQLPSFLTSDPSSDG